MKSIKYGVLTLLALATIMGTEQKVSAAKPESHDTEAIINFKSSDEGTGPVDPTDPEKPIEPIDPENPDYEIPEGTFGPLSIDFASKLYFGENKISSQNEIYKVKAQPVKDGEGVRYIPNYVQITDNRGTLEGWTLSVKQNGQFTTEDNYLLEGAEIRFNNGKLNSISESEAPSKVEESFELKPDETQIVVAANENEGAGTWAYLFGSAADFKQGEEYIENDSITLFIPGSSIKLAESYSTSLTWTLSDVPEND